MSADLEEEGRSIPAATAHLHRSDGRWRSEGAALTWGDVDYYEDSTARITIQKGKNQPHHLPWRSPKAPPETFFTLPDTATPRPPVAAHKTPTPWLSTILINPTWRNHAFQGTIRRVP